MRYNAHVLEASQVENYRKGSVVFHVHIGGFAESEYVNRCILLNRVSGSGDAEGRHVWLTDGDISDLLERLGHNRHWDDDPVLVYVVERSEKPQGFRVRGVPSTKRLRPANDCGWFIPYRRNLGKSTSLPVGFQIDDREGNGFGLRRGVLSGVFDHEMPDEVVEDAPVQMESFTNSDPNVDVVGGFEYFDLDVVFSCGGFALWLSEEGYGMSLDMSVYDVLEFCEVLLTPTQLSFDAS